MTKGNFAARLIVLAVCLVVEMGSALSDEVVVLDVRQGAEGAAGALMPALAVKL